MMLSITGDPMKELIDLKNLENLEKLREETLKELEWFYKTVRRYEELAEKGVERCDIWDLSVYMGDTAEYLGLARLASKLFPDDPKIRKYLRDAIAHHHRAYRLRDEFTYRCETIKRE